MKKAKIFTTTVLLLVTVILLGSMTFFFNFYAKNIILKKNCEIATNENTSYKDQMKTSIANEKEIIDNLTGSASEWEKDVRFVDFQIIPFDSDDILNSIKPYFEENDYYIGLENKIFTTSTTSDVLLVFKKATTDSNYLFIRPFDLTLYAKTDGATLLVSNDMSIISSSSEEYSGIDSLRYFFDGYTMDDLAKEMETSFTKDNKSYYLFATSLSEEAKVKSDYYVTMLDEKLLNTKTGALTFVAILYAVASFVIVIVLMVGIYHFIDQKNNQIQAARESFRTAKKYIVILDRNGKIKARNLAFRLELFGAAKAKNINELSSDVDLIAMVWKEKTFVFVCKNADEEEMSLQTTVLLRNHGYQLIMEDVTEKVKFETHMKELAWTNPITHLPNQNALEEELGRDYEKNGLENLVSAVIVFDIANFKSMNKAFGRAMSETILLRFIDKITPSIQEGNKLYHLESDYFAILIPFSKELIKDETQQVKALLDNLKTPMKMGSNILMLKLKAGIYNIDNTEGITPAEAIKNADIALKSASASRLVDYVVYDIKVGQIISQELLMEKDLRQAINREEFVMYYQPQYSMKTKKIVAFEALIRWNNPKYLHESPEGWIKIAEQNNMIIEIGEQQLRMTLRKAKEVEKYGIHISINVSPVQLLQDGFVIHFVELVKEYDVQPELLSVEITETFLMESFDEVVEKIKLLKRYGFKIHLDDFGTGYSSMLYLQQLPVDVIKIDKEFTKNVIIDKYSRSIVVEIIQLAKSLELDTITEGVETDKQAQFLLKTGCDVIQGYLISKPVDEITMIELIKKYNGEEAKK